MGITRRSILLSGLAVAVLGAVGDVNQLPVPPQLVDAVGGVGFPAVAAHRGGADLFPENTMAGFRRAAELGPHLVLEMDVLALGDGTLVLCHGTTVDGLSANGVTGTVADMTHEQWANLMIKHPSGGAPAPAAFLSEVLEEFGGTGRVLMIELKNPALRDSFMDALRPYRDQVVACSFDANTARILAGSGFHAQFLSSTTPTSIPDGLNSIGVKDTAITPALCAAAHAKGAKVWAWGVSLRNQDTGLLAMGVDGFIVNDPTI